MVKQNPVTLSFRSRSLEQAFAEKTFASRLFQARCAYFIATLLYFGLALLDGWLVPDEHRGTVWTIRLAAFCVPTLVMICSFTPIFARAADFLLALCGLAASMAFIATVPLIPLEKLTQFYSSIVITTITCYCLIGTRFIYTFVVELIVIVAYNLVFLKVHGANLPILLNHDFFILAGNLMGGAAGYLQEYQKRKLFLREQELDFERQKHLDRSLRDALTGLPNRELLNDRLTQALAQSHRDGTQHACFFVDLDGFKKVNDSLGHAVGDKVLQAVAAQLSIAVRDTDTVARVGGDEFFVVCRSITSEAAAALQAQRLIEHIEAAYVDQVAQGAISGSIGICLLPFAGATVSSIISAADKAMYRAKTAGRGNYRFDGQTEEYIESILPNFVV
jgi:diguanylate cyclase